MRLARISLTLSLHVSLSFIASGRPSGLHTVSSHSCCMYVRAGRPALDCPYAGVHRSTSLTISSLLLQQCPACLVRLASGVVLHVNAHKTEFMCFNHKGDISTLDGTSLKLVDKFTYLGSSVSSTEKDIDTRLTKPWTAINRLSIIWKSNLTDKMKRSFF